MNLFLQISQISSSSIEGEFLESDCFDLGLMGDILSRLSIKSSSINPGKVIFMFESVTSSAWVVVLGSFGIVGSSKFFAESTKEDFLVLIRGSYPPE